jgi:flagellar biosynthesis regulator FlbT
MSDKSRLLISDHILDPDPSVGNPLMYLLDVQMMVLYGAARERTEDEFSQLLATAGLGFVRVIRTRSQFPIVEAVPR